MLIDYVPLMNAHVDVSEGSGVESKPRAMVHRKILEIAGSNPEMPVAAIAENVSGASAALVDRVLDEFGDPGSSDERASSANGTEPTETEAPAARGEPRPTDSPAGPTEDGPVDASPESEPDLSELTESQVETLRVVRARPTATQKRVAEELDVSRATVSKRLNQIPGFEWSARRDFVEQLFGSRGGDAGESGRQRSVGPSRAELARRVDALETRLTPQPTPDGGPTVSPELTHKVVHACIDAEYITEAEELQILRGMLPGAPTE